MLTMMDRLHIMAIAKEFHILNTTSKRVGSFRVVTHSFMRLHNCL
jgi:hypothetical protein